MKSQVFISYSHEDAVFLLQLKRHFKPFQNRISFWDDNNILAGHVWKEEIDMALQHAKIAMLLISADFFNSKFINEVELPILLEAAEKRGTIILSIILKPCLFSEYPQINKYQTVNLPSKTVIQMNEAEQEELYVRLMLIVKELTLF